MHHGAEFSNEVLGYTVLDGAGNALGLLTALYLDAETREPAFAAVTMIRRGRRRAVFAPLTDALIEGTTVTLCCGGQLVRRAPAVQAGRQLPADAEPGLYAYYDMPYVPVTSAPRRLLPASR